MSNYVFSDFARTKMLTAGKYKPSIHDGWRLFCPNPDCPAIMHFRKSSIKRRAHFYGTHSGYCKLVFKNIDRTEHSESLFLFPDALALLEKNPSAPTNRIARSNSEKTYTGKRPLRTVREIFLICKNLDINDCYNSYPIYSILADERSFDIYKTAIRGYHIVECTFYRYDAISRTIFFNYPRFDGKGYYPHVSVFIPDSSLFEYFKGIICKKDHKTRYAISSLWKQEPSGKTIATGIIHNKRQAWIISG